jgi:outer membrane protein Omp28/PEGA domain-containing protein
MLAKNLPLLVLSILVIASCGLKQPEFIPETEIPTGSIYVNSNITGARIFVNSDSTGKVTPDTIKNIPVGSVIVQVFKDGYLIAPDSISVDVNSDSIVTAMFSLEFITNQGKLFFNSMPDGAEILVNGSSVGKFTPDTVIVAAGIQHTALYKNGFDSLDLGDINVATNSLTLFDETLTVEKQVLIESFANSSCLPCTTTNSHLENFMGTVHHRNYALIEHFTNWPNPLDPMFQHNPIDNTERFTYYEVIPVPSMFIIGNAVNPLSYIDIFNTFNTSYNNANQDISITLSKQITDSLKVNIEVHEFNPMPSGHWHLFIAVIEKEVIFSSPPGSNGLSEFSHVFRKYLTYNDGDELNFTNNKFYKSYTSSLSSEWDLNEIQIIGFIQDRVSKNVIKSSHL